MDDVLIHFDPFVPLGLATDTSQVGVGATLFHCLPGGSERPIVNASKTLTQAQRRYGQIQKEALAIVFGFTKFYLFLYRIHFFLVTDHKPLLTLFGPLKPVPALVANRLACWAILLNQFDYYQIEYRKTNKHQNADALSCLPSGEDPVFDKEDNEVDVDIDCAIQALSLQVQPPNSTTIQKKTAKDPV